LSASAHNENFKNPPILSENLRGLSRKSAAIVIAEYVNYEIPQKLNRDEQFKRELSIYPASEIRLFYRVIKKLKGSQLKATIPVPDVVYLECKNNVISVKDLNWLPKKNSKWIFLLKSSTAKEASSLGYNCWFREYGGRVPYTQENLKVIYQDLEKP